MMILARALSSLALVMGVAAHAASINGCPIRPATLCLQFDLPGADLGGANLRTTTFAGGQKLADLDEHMGVFRTIRSMKLTCK
jgi:hypothetical protein